MASDYTPRVAEFVQQVVIPQITRSAFMGADYPLNGIRCAVESIALVLTRCESPIEQLVALALIADWGVELESEIAKGGPFARELWSGAAASQQVESCGYRLDFAIVAADGRWKIALECDGHNFHERTPDQAARDKARDRALTADGWRVLRFTGREIHRDPVAVVREVATIVAQLAKETP